MMTTTTNNPAENQFSNWEAVKQALVNAAANLVPPPDMKPSEWAQQNVVIPVGNAIPGPINFDNAPYQRGMLDAIKEPGIVRVSYMTGAQLGKTTVQQCTTGYFIAHEPRSQIFVQPTQGDVQTFLETKLRPMLEANPKISDRMAKPRGREGVNNSRIISYIGGWLMFSWAGSPKTLRGRSAPVTQADEIDGMDATPEGDPVQLLTQRGATFGDQRLQTESSTPTVKGESRIETGFEEGDQRRYYVPCPDCGVGQYLKWQNVRWDGRQSVGIDDYEKDLNNEHLPESAMYCCEECGSLWDDGQRIAAIRGAEAAGYGWMAAKPFRGHASFHAPELLSTFRRLRDIVQSYLDKIAVQDMQSFVNVSLGETYEEKGEKADPTSLLARAEASTYSRGFVPAGGLYLTAGIDAQIDRLELEVVAWGHGEQSWQVDYVVLWGDPLAGDVWNDLDDYLLTTFQHEYGVSLPISAACLDTGGTKSYTQTAYDWLKGKTGRRIFGVKGVSGWGKPIVEKPQRKQSGKHARKVDLFLVAVDEAKQITTRRLAVAKPGPGYCHFPVECDQEYFDQMTAEKLVTRYVKGFPVKEWKKPDRARNEAFDTRNYAYAAVKINPPNFKRIEERILAATKNAAPAPAPLEERPAPKPAPAPAPVKPVTTPKPQEEPAPQTTENVVIKATRKLQKRRKTGSFATKW